jgi:hypothetical protein
MGHTSMSLESPVIGFKLSCRAVKLDSYPQARPSDAQKTPYRTTVPTENSESGEKSRVLGFAAIVFSACLNVCVSSSPLSFAGFAVGPFWNWRT